MASEDVLERAERLLAKCPGYELPPYTDTLIVEDLAAEVRELRKDKARLDFLESEMDREQAAISNGEPIPTSLFRRNMPVTRASIDAAMGATEND